MRNLLRNLLPRPCRPWIVAVIGVGLFVGQAARVTACPFCSAVSLTFAQEIAQSQAAVIVKLVEPPPKGALSPRAEGPLPKGRFAVVEVLKGGDLVAEAGHSGADGKPIETILLEEKPVGTLFLLMGVEPPALVWSSPIPVSDRAVAYLRKLASLPEKGSDRLAFFQQHLEDPDETLARDAYDEFAVAPYADVRGLADRMRPAQLLEWIENPKVQANRRRLYATMLGTCGTKADADRIGRILANQDLGADKAEVRSGLDALIACYVTLRGPDGLDLVDELFLDRRGREVPFTETYAAVMALRFLGEESERVPKERVLKSLRRLLDEPKLADLVIADLARWQDWSVIDRLVELFEKAEADNIFVREPVVNYLRACPLPEAAAAIAKLEKIDPEAVRRAATLAAFAGAAGAKPAAAPAGSTAGGSPSADDGDAGDPTTAAAGSPADGPGMSPATATQATPAEDALAARIPAVLADEEATDDTPGRDPASAEPARPAAGAAATGGPTPAAGGSKLLRWAIWGAIVLAIAIFSRAKLRAGGSGPAAR
ncbi:MAG: hypothetical protein ACKOHG_19430 [Planctomycetia bacterium]